MAFWDWLTGRKKADRELLSAFIQAQGRRIDADEKRDALQAQLTLKKLELEMENIERLGEEKRKDAADRARLREQRKEWAKTAREKKARTAVNGSIAHSGLAGCRVCANGSDPTLTADEIHWHAQGHPGAIQA